jgi:L-asparagine transporter-like permease
MFFSLARGNYAPAWLGRLSKNGVPRHALIASTGGMIAAILLAIYAPEKAFLLLYGIAVAGMFFVWGIILVTHIAFRRALSAERIARLPMRLPFAPFSAILGIVALLGIAIATFFVDGLRYTVPSFVPFLLVISLVYWKIRRSDGAGTSGGQGESLSAEPQ